VVHGRGAKKFNQKCYYDAIFTADHWEDSSHSLFKAATIELIELVGVGA
jgi:hypothetical protein